MTRTRLLRFAAAGLALVLVAGCNDDEPDDTTNTDTTETATDTGPSSSTTETTSTTPTTRADDYSIPAVIDAAYVDHVLKALNRVDGDALRIAVAQKQITMEVTDRLLAINTTGYVDIPLASYSDLSLSGFAQVRAEPGDAVMLTKQLAKVANGCLLALVSADYSERAAQPAAALDTYVVLRSSALATDPNHLNPTPWALDNVFVPDSLGAIPAESRCGD